MRQNNQIMGVFFDVGGTLNYNSDENWMFPQKAEGLINLDGIYYIPIKRFNEAYKICRGYLDENKYIKTMEEEYECFKTFYTMMAKYLPEFELDSEKIDILAHDKVYGVESDLFYDDVYDTLEKLSPQYKLGIISDEWPSCENILKAANLHKFFDCIALSCHTGSCKKETAIYLEAIERMGIPASQTMLVDDSKENLLIAKGLGMVPVLINTASKAKDSDMLTIHSISEIFDCL